MDAELLAPRCPVHADAEALGTCARCGRFTCARCGRDGFGQHLCSECLARPQERLAVSARAKQALLCALLGLNGVVVLLPVAVWLASAELRDEAQGRSPAAGRAWARGALGLSAVGALAWLLAAWVALRAWE